MEDAQALRIEPRLEKLMNVTKVDLNLVNKETGEVLGEVTPRFTQWSYDDYFNEFKTSKELRFLEPMTAQELSEDKLTTFLKENKVIAEQKFDGHRGLIYFTSKGNRVFSRRVSKQTGWFAENTDQMPHIRDIKVPEHYIGTVIDGEILLPLKNCTCRDVQSVTGALPETAIENQLNRGFAYLSAFDILYYRGLNIQRMPLWKRKVYLWKVLSELNSPFIKTCPIYSNQETLSHLTQLWRDYKVNDNISSILNKTNDIEQQFIDFLKEGKEGLIIKDINGIYEQKRSKAFIKMKAHKTFDVVIMGYDEPTKEYTGKELDKWEYFDGNTPVTKYYYQGWIGAIVFGVWKDGKLIEVGRTSGMDETTREMLSLNREHYLGAVIEVEAQGIIDKDKGSLQHPRYIMMRPDKNSEQCTFEDHIRKDN